MANDPASTRTAASRVRFLGAAKSGTTDAWRMRITSVALLPLTIAFVWIVLSLVGKDYSAARAELGQPVPAILLLLFILSGVYHMKIGMQSIIDDYVHSPHLKDLSLIANLFFSVSVGLACIYAVLKLSFA
ncbi:succinate dehydrogenase, hydrophobic membrane anchor protein [Methylocapsa polymorpha]|uniref:Succinate dehydrogenase hydrophobic membrane anchor subunit n=1 Tax=Methylocapsa polymorpha TaxID=3080828 RepID=A0ABZ0HPC5_9HYPH|nr:succinate dehydrogenase, hydrophobic membrane anchor protein [Methylocapsa sp. RX1]